MKLLWHNVCYIKPYRTKVDLTTGGGVPCTSRNKIGKHCTKDLWSNSAHLVQDKVQVFFIHHILNYTGYNL